MLMSCDSANDLHVPMPFCILHSALTECIRKDLLCLFFFRYFLCIICRISGLLMSCASANDLHVPMPFCILHSSFCI